MHDMTAPRRHAFSMWLRTGRWSGQVDNRGLEHKFDPWHDPRNGRFTFAGTGRYFGPGDAVAANGGGQDVPRVQFIDDPARAPIANMEAADAWAAEQLAKHGNIPGYPEAIEARLQLYRDAFASRYPDPRDQVAEFVGGVGEATSDIAKGTIAGLYSLFTTNPITTARTIGLGIARSIDAAIAAEGTPARVQFSRAANSVANASARDIGYGVGTVAVNIGMAVVPGAAAEKISAARRAADVGIVTAVRVPPKIVWVDENVGLKGLAKDYNDSATGARSNVRTKRGQVPALERTMPDGTTRLVKFDGVDGDTVIDRKRSIVTTQKAKNKLCANPRC